MRGRRRERLRGEGGTMRAGKVEIERIIERERDRERERERDREREKDVERERK